MSYNYKLDSLRSRIILIALKGTKLQFDVGDLRVIFYEDHLGGEKEAIPKIQEMLKSILNEVHQQDSPVLYAIPELAEVGMIKDHEARLSSLQKERDLLKAQLEILEKTSFTNQASLEAMCETIETFGEKLSVSQQKNAQEDLNILVKEKQASVPAMTLRDLEDIVVDPKAIFVLMPFQDKFSSVYKAIVHAAQEVGLECFRADTFISMGSIIDQIFEAIAKCGFIVADVTDRNQNVMYELGIANTMGKSSLILSQDMTSVPFDIRSQRILTYKYAPENNFKDLILDLIKIFKQYNRENNI